MITKSISIIRSFLNIIFLKLKYGSKIKFSSKIFLSNIESCYGINIINGSIKLGDKISIRKNARLGVSNGTIEIGDKCFINNNTAIVSMGKISIGNNCTFGPNVCIYDHDHDYNHNGLIPNKYTVDNVTIGNNVWLGAGVIILKGTEIGDNSIVAAGTIVKGKYSPNSLIYNEKTIKVKSIKEYKK